MSGAQENQGKKTLTLGLGLVFLTSIGLGACNRMADEALCEKAYQHIFDLKHPNEPEPVKKVAADKDKDNHMKFLKACVGKESEDRIHCFLESASPQELKECENAE